MKEKVKEINAKAKAFVTEHKGEIVTGAVCLLIGAAGATLVTYKRAEMVASQKNTAALIWKPVQILNQIKFGDPKGRPGIRSVCLENGLGYESIRDAADQLHLNRDELAAHLRGELSDVAGKHFINVGPAFVPEGATAPVAA